MKIGFITSEYVYDGNITGGLANYLKKTGDELARRGNEVIIFTYSNSQNRYNCEGVTIIQVNIKLIQRFIIQCLNFSNASKFLIPITNQFFIAHNIAKSVLKEHKKQPLSIIQTSITGYGLGFSILKNKRFPVVCRISSYQPLNRSALGVKRSLANILVDWFLLHQITRADSAYVPSRHLQTIYKRFEAIDVDLIRTPIEFYTGELDNSFYDENLSGCKYLLFFGTLNGIKGADLIGPVIPTIIQKYPDIVFVFIGSDSYLPDGSGFFQSILKNTGVSEKNIRYFPPLPKKMLYPVIRQSYGVILPSRTDNYPNTCLEALFCYVPVIGTDNSSLDEMITDKVTGFIAKNGDSESIYHAIDMLLSLSPDEIAEMKKNISKWVEEVKEEDRIGMLIKYYQRVINEYCA